MAPGMKGRPWRLHCSRKDGVGVVGVPGDWARRLQKEQPPGRESAQSSFLVLGGTKARAPQESCGISLSI